MAVHKFVGDINQLKQGIEIVTVPENINNLGIARSTSVVMKI